MHERRVGDRAGVSELAAALLASPEALADSWVERAGRDAGERARLAPTFRPVAEALVRQLTSDEPVRCPEIADLSVGDLTILRELLHEQLAGAAEAEALSSVLLAADRAVDSLLLDLVETRVKRLEFDALVDPLTGVGNRRALERDLERSLAQAVRHGHPLSVVMIDLDGLKAVNDRHGHDAGDQALKALAGSFVENLRLGDGFYRTGGDEFVAVLHHADGDQAIAFVERVRAGAPPFSAGIATAPGDGSTPAELLDAADQHLLGRRNERKRERALPPPTLDGPRPLVIGASVTTSRTATTVEVRLSARGMERGARVIGPPISGAEPRLAAMATLEALAQLGYPTDMAYVDSAEVRPVGGHHLATVAFWVRAAEAELLVSGSAAVQRSPAEAAAQAVTQAVTTSTLLEPRVIELRT